MIDVGIINESGKTLFNELEERKDIDPSSPLACLPAVLLCLPPFGDYEDAKDRLEKLAVDFKNSHAPIWLSFIFTNLHSTEPDYLQHFNNIDVMTAEHYFSLADTYSLMGDVSRSLPLCLTSCEMRLFPKNLRLICEISQKVRHFTDTDVKSLVIKNDAEKQYFNSIEELYLFYWKEFITGEYVTSPVWKMILERDI